MQNNLRSVYLCTVYDVTHRTAHPRELLFEHKNTGKQIKMHLFLRLNHFSVSSASLTPSIRFVFNQALVKHVTLHLDTRQSDIYLIHTPVTHKHTQPKAQSDKAQHRLLCNLIDVSIIVQLFLLWFLLVSSSSVNSYSTSVNHLHCSPDL